MQRIFTILFFIAGWLHAHCQEMVLSQIEELQFDLTARIKPVNDNNGNPCALLKIYIPSIREAVFKGDVVNVHYHTGEYSVYVKAGTKTINIEHPTIKSAKVEFDSCNINLQEKTTYRLVFKKKTEVQNIASSNEVKINSNPELAYVLMDGMYVGQTPLLLTDAMPGKHLLTIKAEGYDVYDKEIDVFADKKAVYNVKLLKEAEPTEIFEEGELYGLRKGEDIIVPAIYDEISGLIDFSAANEEKMCLLFSVCSKGKWGILDEYGNEITALQYDCMIQGFPGDGGAYNLPAQLVIVSKDGKYGYIDPSDGRVCVPVIFDNVYGFDIYALDGEVKYNGKNAIIDRKGNLLLDDFDYEYKWLTSDYLIFKVDEKWGIVNKKKEIVISPKYDELELSFRVGDSNQVLFKAKLDGKTGIIDEWEKNILPFLYDEIEIYAEDAPIKCVIDGKYIFLDRKTLKQISPLYDKVEVEYEYGFSEVYMKKDWFSEVYMNKKWGCIDRQGNIIVPLEFDGISHYYDGEIVKFNVKKGENWGIWDINNKIEIPIYYDNILPRSGCYILSRNSKYGLANKKGFLILQCIYDEIIPNVYDNTDFEGLFAVKSKGLWGCVNLDGKIVVPIEYDKVDFAANWNIKVYKNNQCGAFDKFGKLIAPINYEDFSFFKNDIAFVKRNGLWGGVGTNGVVCIPFEYSYIRDFDNISVEISKSERCGILNVEKQKGKIDIPCLFDHICHYTDKYVFGEKNKVWSVYDKSGKQIIPETYDVISSCTENRMFVMKNNKWGVIDDNAEIVAPCKYLEHEDFRNGVAFVKLYDWGQIDVNGRVVTPFNYRRPYENEKEREEFECDYQIYFEENENGMYAVYNKEGDILLPAICETYSQVHNGDGSDYVWQIVVNGKTGFFSKEGKQITPFMYDAFIPFFERNNITYVRKTKGDWTEISFNDLVK